jgi:adenine phosphoribosyltransferase
MDLKSYIRDVADFPKAGIMFKDITPLLSRGPALKYVTESFVAHARAQGVTKICGIESRGFILGAPVATALEVGFVPIRKKGKIAVSEAFAGIRA